jgi:hypothetical protein
MNPHRRHKVEPQAEAVVTKAVQRAATALGLNQRELGQVLGISEAKVSRLGEATLLDPKRKELELAKLFIRLYRSLDTLVGGDDVKSALWLHADNDYFGGVPAELVKTVEGLTSVVHYLDAMRGPL